MSKPKTLAGKTLVDTETGKYIDGKKFIVYNNKTAEQQEKEAENQIKKNEELKECLERSDSEMVALCGKYFHLWYQDMIEENQEEEDRLLPQMAVRLLRLACDMDYNCVVKGVTASSKDLEKVLKLSTRETKKTLKYLKENNLIEIQEDNKIKIVKFVNKGSLNMKQYEILQNHITRVFSNGFKELYDNLYVEKEVTKGSSVKVKKYEPKHQKNLFYFILLLPWCNVDYNVICENPNEKDPTKIVALNWEDIYKKFELPKSTARDVKKMLFSLKIKDKYAIMEMKDGDGIKIIINPRLFFRGKLLDFANRFANYFDIH